MSLPDFCAGPDGFFRFGPGLADMAGMLVAMEVARRINIEPNLNDRETWTALFDQVVQPAYNAPHTGEQMQELEEKVRRFVDSTAANYRQVRRLRELQNLPNKGLFS